MTEYIKIKYQEGAHKLEKIAKGDWIDLYLYEDRTLAAGEFTILPLGVSMRLPKGYEAVFVARSSTFKKYGLLQTNAMAVIDSSYCGDDDIWGMPVYATRDVELKKDMRLCQFRIQKNQPKIVFDEVESLGGKARGAFGSTGD